MKLSAIDIDLLRVCAVDDWTSPEGLDAWAWFRWKHGTVNEAAFLGRLPKPLRDAIWREYRPGQENDKNPSARYMAVQRRAIGVLLFKPNNERAAALAAPYFMESEVWRQRAIEAGDGDPLEGIAT